MPVSLVKRYEPYISEDQLRRLKIGVTKYVSHFVPFTPEIQDRHIEYAAISIMPELIAYAQREHPVEEILSIGGSPDELDMKPNRIKLDVHQTSRLHTMFSLILQDFTTNRVHPLSRIYLFARHFRDELGTYEAPEPNPCPDER